MIDFDEAVQSHLAGRWDEAEAAYRRILLTTPERATIHQNLARLLLENGRFPEAMDALEAALALEPKSVELALLSGRVWIELGDFPQAAGWFQRVLRLEPHNTDARCQLGVISLEIGNPEKAEWHFRALLATEPEHVGARHGLARALLEQGDAVEAVREHRAAILAQPQLPALHSSLGQSLANSGDLDGAAECFRAALRLNPKFFPALGGLATTLRGKLPDGELEPMERLLEAAWMPPEKRATLHFGLGQVYDGRGDCLRAAEHAALANREQARAHGERDQAYDPAEYRKYIDNLIGQFTPEYFARTRGFGSESRRPIFIVGMPRSGTTLVEQVLASHPAVSGAGERRFVNLGFSALPAATDSAKPPAHCLPVVTAEIVRRIANWHLGQLEKADPHHPRVADKMPDNFALLGWIATLFPRAAILHCTRDVRDVAVSCWVTNFSQIRWANDLGHIAERVNDYRRVMAHYRTVLPVPVLDVPYEAMVSDLEGTTRRMLEFAQLDWDANCLKFHETERLVKTASVAQVRQPIYQKSVARWKRYEEALGPFLAMLTDPP